MRGRIKKVERMVLLYFVKKGEEKNVGGCIFKCYYSRIRQMKMRDMVHQLIGRIKRTKENE